MSRKRKSVRSKYDGLTMAERIDGVRPTPRPAICPNCWRETMSPAYRSAARTCEHCGYEFVPGLEARDGGNGNPREP